jgi:hypothetical protein
MSGRSKAMAGAGATTLGQRGAGRYDFCHTIGVCSTSLPLSHLVCWCRAWFAGVALDLRIAVFVFADTRRALHRTADTGRLVQPEPKALPAYKVLVIR